ncbi:cation/H(+) antiporter 15 isoform X1 [Ziziphus jujuba]|uniref:Cation/H(+) antiporter 15 isoform X1 n=2 Tax=Ziziphus jujuba TaxID=326968 RepID=A0A6P3YUL8_ZIZJJ|nr:cation/H(+) antiporter 15 isoform X1 [Ziziphus jujuba]
MGTYAVDADDLTIYGEEEWGDGVKNMSSICMSFSMIHSDGFFSHSNPLHYSVPLLLLQFALASSAILLTSQLLKPLSQPIFVSQILGGIILGPSVLSRSSAFLKNFFPLRGFVVLDILSSIGYMLCFFLIGVQTDPWILMKINKTSSTIGFFTVAVPMFITQAYSYIIPKILPVETTIANFLPAIAQAESVLSFPTIAFFLSELRILNSDFGKLAMSSSVVSGLFSFLLTTLAVLSHQSIGDNFKMLATISTGVLVAVVIVFAVRPAVLWMIKKNPPGEILKESHIIALLVGVLVTGFCCQATGLHIYYGPLILGITIPAGPPLGSALMEKLEFSTSWILMPIFFVKNGMMIDIFDIKFGNFMIVLSLALLGALGKFIGAFITSLLSGMPLMDAITLSLVLIAQGLMELGLFKMSKYNKAEDKETFTIMCISMLIITGILSPLVKQLYDPSRRYAAYGRRSVMQSKWEPELRVLVCLHDHHDVPTAIDLLEALHPIKRCPLAIYLLHQIELVGRATPLFISHKLSKRPSSIAGPSEQVINAFRCYEESRNGIVSVHPFTAMSPGVTMHDDICFLALDKRTSLAIIPFYKLVRSDGTIDSYRNAGKIMNKNVINQAPCSVAILVNRGFLKTPRLSLPSWSLYRVAILFLGGDDDREALAIAERMCGHSKIRLTLIRLVSGNYMNENAERRADNESLSEFRHCMEGNYRVMYIEEVVMDGSGTIAVIRSMENSYDLVLVGKNHDPESPLVSGLKDWNEQPELGEIGDILISADFMGNTTILVVQQQPSKVEKQGNEKCKNLLEECLVGDDKIPF